MLGNFSAVLYWAPWFSNSNRITKISWCFLSKCLHPTKQNNLDSLAWWRRPLGLARLWKNHLGETGSLLISTWKNEIGSRRGWGKPPRCLSVTEKKEVGLGSTSKGDWGETKAGRQLRGNVIIQKPYLKPRNKPNTQQQHWA